MTMNRAGVSWFNLRSKNLSRDRSKYGRDCIDEQVYDHLISAKSGSRGAK